MLDTYSYLSYMEIRMRFQLSPKGIRLAEEFERLFGDVDCLCNHHSDPSEDWFCSKCRHPGNPRNIQEDDTNITNILIIKEDPFDENP